MPEMVIPKSSHDWLCVKKSLPNARSSIIISESDARTPYSYQGYMDFHGDLDRLFIRNYLTKLRPLSPNFVQTSSKLRLYYYNNYMTSSGLWNKLGCSFELLLCNVRGATARCASLVNPKPALWRWRFPCTALFGGEAHLFLMVRQ